MQRTIGERGQITIPKSVRDQLGLHPGMSLIITVGEGSFTVRKPPIGEALEIWAGTASKDISGTDAFLSQLRDGEDSTDENGHA